jgi:hypothetical protein
LALSRCRVSFKDTDGMEHAVEVDAETLYEAVALAVKEFQHDEVSQSCPAPMTEFTVTVFRKPTEHKIRLSHVQKMGADHHQGRTGRHHKAGARKDASGRKEMTPMPSPAALCQSPNAGTHRPWSVHLKAPCRRPPGLSSSLHWC